MEDTFYSNWEHRALWWAVGHNALGGAEGIQETGTGREARGVAERSG